MTRQEEKQMKRIAKFHKVSKERFTADWTDTFAQSQEEAEKVYEAIRLPKRATAGSAGYDFLRTGRIYSEARRNSEDPDRNPRGNAAGMGTEMLSPKWTGI